MRVIIQRVKQAYVDVEEIRQSYIESGLLVLVGFETTDNIEDIHWIAKKLLNLRIFNDEKGKMNYSVQDVEGDILVVSQFTLYASTKKGNRPSYTRSASPDIAKQLYHQFIQYLTSAYQKDIYSGVFGANMQVGFINSGPVTISIDSKHRE